MPKLSNRTHTPARRKRTVLARQRRALDRILSAPNPAIVPYPPLEAARRRVFSIIEGKEPNGPIFEAMMDVKKAELARKMRYHQNLERIVKYAQRLYDWYSINFKSPQELKMAHAFLRIARENEPFISLSKKGISEIQNRLSDLKEWEELVKSGRAPPNAVNNFIQRLSRMSPEELGLRDRPTPG